MVRLLRLGHRGVILILAGFRKKTERTMHIGIIIFRINLKPKGCV